MSKKPSLAVKENTPAFVGGASANRPASLRSGSQTVSGRLLSAQDRSLESYRANSCPFHAGDPLSAADGDGPSPSHSRRLWSQEILERLCRPGAVGTR